MLTCVISFKHTWNGSVNILLNFLFWIIFVHLIENGKRIKFIGWRWFDDIKNKIKKSYQMKGKLTERERERERENIRTSVKLLYSK